MEIFSSSNCTGQVYTEYGLTVPPGVTTDCITTPDAFMSMLGSGSWLGFQLFQDTSCNTPADVQIDAGATNCVSINNVGGAVAFTLHAAGSS